MEPGFRAAYNAAFSQQAYERYAGSLREQLRCEPGFRLAETPVFFPPDFVARCERAATEIVAQLCEPERLERMRGAVPARFDADGRGDAPQFAVVDFGIARDADGGFVPRVVELQGFPSLLAFELLQRDAWVRELDATLPHVAWSCWYGGLDRSAFIELARRAILSDEDPANVVLLDVQPELQKTYCDFAATRLLFGVEACDPRALHVRNGRLYRRDAGGREIQITRIYNRVVGDDYERLGAALPFDVRDDLGATWAPHPAWFWHWSKASLPYLDHPCVPRTRLLSELDESGATDTASGFGLARNGDAALENCVLKPLFSFAGAGVNVRPTRDDLAAISTHERAGWCVQEKIPYADVFATPQGDPVKVEIRVLLVRPDDAPSLMPATNLCRLSRGDMIGVDFNRDRTWVGSSIGLWRS